MPPQQNEYGNADNETYPLRREVNHFKTTLQPCAMCSMASIWASISRIVYGAGRDQVYEMYFEDCHLGLMDYISDAYKGDLTITGGVLTKTVRGYIMVRMITAA